MKKVAKIQNVLITTQVVCNARIFTVIDMPNNKIIADMIETFADAVIKANDYLGLIKYIKE